MSTASPNIPVSLIYTRTPWNEVPRARHYFAKALSERKPVAFLAANKWGFFARINVQEAGSNYWCIQPTWYLPFKVRYRIPFLNKLYNGWLRKAIAMQLNLKISEVITFDHTSLAFVDGHFDYVYYVNDDHTRAGAKKFNFFAKQLVQEEKLLAAHAQLVITTAADLQQRFELLNKKTFLIPLGAPEVTISAALAPASQLTRVVFLGVLNSVRIPLELMNALHESGKYEIHCIGPSDSAFRKWATSKNTVHLHNALTGEALLLFLQTCHVGIAPYKQNSANSGVTPSKLWHYFAAGIPVVYSQLPSITLEENYRTHAIGANNDSSFLAAIDELSTKDNLSMRNERMQIAKDNSWAKRVDQFLNLREKR